MLRPLSLCLFSNKQKTKTIMKARTIKLNKVRKAVAVALGTNVMNIDRETVAVFYKKAA